MRHRMLGRKFGRSMAHRKALVASLVCALVEQRRIKTGIHKAKEAGRLADAMVTLGKKGSLAARRRALALLRRKEIVRALFDTVVPSCSGRQGGYTRVVRLGRRTSDGTEMAILEWVNLPAEPKRKKKEKEVKSEEKSG